MRLPKIDPLACSMGRVCELYRPGPLGTKIACWIIGFWSFCALKSLTRLVGGPPCVIGPNAQGSAGYVMDETQLCDQPLRVG